MHQTHDKGDIAEAAVVLSLTKLGFTVFKPLTQNTYADLVILKDDRLETIQVKYVTPVGGKLQVPTRKQSSNTKEIRETYKYNQTPLSWIAVYCPDPECVLYLPRSAWVNNDVVFNVRITPPKNNQTSGINLATDFYNI
jgi:hypothetical protein